MAEPRGVKPRKRPDLRSLDKQTRKEIMMEEQLNQVIHQAVSEDSPSNGLGMLSLKILAILVILMIVLAFISDSPITGVFD